MATVYKVYDEEWSKIMGKGQVCEFATYQVCNSEDDYLPENLELFFEPKEIKTITKLVKDVVNGEYVKTLKQAELLLQVRGFDIKPIEVY